MLKIIAWNLAGRVAPWRQLLLDSGGADIALLQEACKPPSDIAEKVSVDPVPWQTDGAGLRGVIQRSKWTGSGRHPGVEVVADFDIAD